MKIIGAWILLAAVVACGALAQQRRAGRITRNEIPAQQNLIERKAQVIDSKEYLQVFQSVEQGIREGSVGTFSGHFGSQVYVSLPGGGGGFFSGNQAYYVLQKYFGGRRIQFFQLSIAGESTGAPYATGHGRTEVDGATENLQVYVALSKIGNRWAVTQINVY